MTDALSDAEKHLDAEGLLDSSGGVLYSASTSLKPCPLYILGLNPGGSEGATLRQSIAASRGGKNAYLDEVWGSEKRLFAKGEALLQRRIQRVAELVKIDLREIPASNLVFTRSKRLGEHMGFYEAIHRCLPVHEIFLEAIQPKLVFMFGNMAHFGKAFNIIEKQSLDAQHDGWQAHRGRAKLGDLSFEFGNVPHLSVWGGSSREHVLRWALEPVL